MTSEKAFDSEEFSKFSLGFYRLAQKYNDKNLERAYYRFEGKQGFINCEDIWGAVLLVFRYIDNFSDRDHGLYGYYNTTELKNFGKDFWELLKTIY